MTALIDKVEKRRFATTDRPRPASEPTAGSRYIAAAVRREVYARDEGRCTFVAADGTRCSETCGLEFHHEVPFGQGGGSTASNVRIVCRAHNLFQAELDYGQAHMRRYTGKARQVQARYVAAVVPGRNRPGQRHAGRPSGAPAGAREAAPPVGGALKGTAGDAAGGVRKPPPAPAAGPDIGVSRGARQAKAEPRAPGLRVGQRPSTLHQAAPGELPPPTASSSVCRQRATQDLYRKPPARTVQ